MILKNPTDQTLSMMYQGHTFVLAPFEAKEFPREVAEHWKSNVHQFLQVTEAETIIKAPEEIKPEVVETIVAEEEKPVEVEVKKAKSKK